MQDSLCVQQGDGQMTKVDLRCLPVHRLPNVANDRRAIESDLQRTADLAEVILIANCFHRITRA